MRLKLITCEVFYREMCATLAKSPNEVDLEFLPKGLHCLDHESMLAEVQRVVDRVDASIYEAVILGYGLCGGLKGLAARDVPVVLPRAHDCISLFLGSRHRYAEYFREHPGTYFKTTGWIERRTGVLDDRQLSIGEMLPGLDADYDALVEKYGEDNAKYLTQELAGGLGHYRGLAFIEMGVEPDDRFERQAKEEAAKRGLEFTKISGSLSLIQCLVDGDWSDEDFLVLEPGQKVAQSFDESVVRSEKDVPGSSSRRDEST